MSAAQHPTEPVELARYICKEGIEQGNTEIGDVFADPVEVLQTAFSDEFSREETIRQLEANTAAFSDVSFDINNIGTIDDLVVVHYTMGGEMTDELRFSEDAVFAPTGDYEEISGVLLVRVEDGEVTGLANYAEQLQFYQNAGFIPPMEDLAEQA